MNNDFPNFKNEIDKIDVPEKKLDLAIERAIKRGKRKKWGLSKKITYLSSAAVIVFSLLIGSAFVSPVMAKVMSNVPLISQILQSMEQTEDREEKLNNFYSEAHETLTNNYQDVVDVSMSWYFSSEPPEIIVRMIDNTSKQEFGDEIEQAIRDFAQSYNIDEVKIKVEVQDKQIAEISKEEQERMELTDQLFNITRKVLQDKGYRYSSLGIDGRNPIINIEIVGTQQHYNNVKDDIEKQVHDAIKSQKGLEYEVEVTRLTEAEIRTQNWQPIFASVMEETHKKFNEVTGFAFSFHPKPLQIILKTSLSDGEQDEKVAEEIAKYANQVVEIKRDELSVDKIPYKIIIRDKEQESLYEILY
ncbi:DUF4179 domain-containing protein [Lentibacillus sediminis]|uniref:DUF4179 domain-containing protein n=1 Tax=Lentibacillus sediminis TaxID=1940529 RepID=UPI000C1C3645|nr:DUF4179 domain-containing protein [Lentibacillus sediminis]